MGDNIDIGVMETLPAEKSLTDTFFDNGFAVLRGVVDVEAATTLHDTFMRNYMKRLEKYGRFAKDGESNVLSFAKSIVQSHDAADLILQINTSAEFLAALEPILGPDISMMNDVGLLVNDPKDNSKVTNKSLHQEQWTGALTDDLVAWIPLTSVCEDNTLSVVPGSHFYGVLPHRNREILPINGFSMGGAVNLTTIDVGDALIFHSLLVHGTAGRGKRLRVTLIRAYRPTFAPMSRRFQARGFTCVKQSALTRIRDALGNDACSPLRVYGGKVSNFPEQLDQEFKY